MRKTRLKNVLELAETRENNAAVGFAEARAAWEFNQARLEELSSFRDDYQSGDSARKSAREFQSTRVFLSQLSEVIDQQEAEVVKALGHMNDKQEDWNSQRVKRRSMEKLIEKRTDIINREEGRREQKELDELSA